MAGTELLSSWERGRVGKRLRAATGPVCAARATARALVSALRLPSPPLPPTQERFASIFLRVLFCKTKDVGSVDIASSAASQELAF